MPPDIPLSCLSGGREIGDRRLGEERALLEVAGLKPAGRYPRRASLCGFRDAQALQTGQLGNTGWVGATREAVTIHPGDDGLVTLS